MAREEVISPLFTSWMIRVVQVGKVDIMCAIAKFSSLIILDIW